MTSVRAFQPRQYDPPRFVAEDGDELPEHVGEFIGAGQCDCCGNSTYRIEQAGNMNSGRYVARCAVDPTDADEFKHPEPCGTAYPINIWEEDLVEF